jgi:signal transduction histidine kinase
LYVDAERTSLALRNLLQNAVQATPDGGEPVEVRIDTDGREVVIEVRDHGPGLAHAAEAQIFDPFMTTKTRGTGLGLYCARRRRNRTRHRWCGRQDHRIPGHVSSLHAGRTAGTAWGVCA